MPELAAGTKVAGRFTLVGRVGRGGMGEVWVARNESTGADVAIKVLRPDRRTVEESEERFRHEARIAAKLNHPNVARVYDLVEEDGTLMLVMERLRGETLRERLQRQGPLSVEEALGVLLPICEALAAAHDVGVVHRDVTPGNIFLADEHGRVVPKLIDFGVAKVDDSPLQTKTGHALGTPQYMSPEQIRIGSVDGRSDEFSMAVTAYETITATNPFKRNVASGSLAAVLETEVDPDARIPPQLWLVLSRGLSKQPYERYATITQLADAMREATGVAPVMPVPAPRRSETSISSEIEVRRTSESAGSVSAEVRATPNRKPWAFVLGGVALLGIVGLVVVLAARGPKGGLPTPGETTTGVGISPTHSVPTMASAVPSTQTLGSASSATPSATIAPPPSLSGKPHPTTRPTTKPNPTTKPSGKPIATTPGF